MVHWAETIGPIARLFERIMDDKPHPEIGYRGCLGIIRLADKYSASAWKPPPNVHFSLARAATERESILKNALDQQPPSSPPPSSTPPHDNIRGSEYFE